MDFPCLSLAHLTVLDAHPLQLIDAAVAGGFDAIGLRIVPPMPGDPLVPVVGNEPLIRELIVKLADTGLSVLDIEVLWLGPDADVDALAPAFDTAQRLGTRNVLAMGNDPVEARMIDTFARVAQLAARFDMGVGLEFMPYLHTATLAQAVRVVQGAAQPRTGVVIDMLHLMRSGGSPAEVAALAPDTLLYAQMCDMRGPRPSTPQALRHEARNARYHPGEGEAPIAQILDAMPGGLPLGVEAPCAQYADLDVVERGRRCGQATRRFLTAYLGRAAGAAGEGQFPLP